MHALCVLFVWSVISRETHGKYIHDDLVYFNDFDGDDAINNYFQNKAYIDGYYDYNNYYSDDSVKDIYDELGYYDAYDAFDVYDIERFWNALEYYYNYMTGGSADADGAKTQSRKSKKPQKNGKKITPKTRQQIEQMLTPIKLSKAQLIKSQNIKSPKLKKPQKNGKKIPQTLGQQIEHGISETPLVRKQLIQSQKLQWCDKTDPNYKKPQPIPKKELDDNEPEPFVWIENLDKLQLYIPCIKYENKDYTIKEFLKKKVAAHLNTQEEEEFDKETNYKTATEQLSPTILFILGPSASGKSYVTKKKFDKATGGHIQAVRNDNSEYKFDAVVVDGDEARKASKATQYFIKMVSTLNTAGAGFAPLYDDYVKKWTSPLKKKLTKKTIAEKKNIIVPITAAFGWVLPIHHLVGSPVVHLPVVGSTIHHLVNVGSPVVHVPMVGSTTITKYFHGFTKTLIAAKKQKYIPYVLVIYATFKLTCKHGVIRGQKSGKAYSTKVYKKSLENALSIIHHGGIPKSNIFITCNDYKSPFDVKKASDHQALEQFEKNVIKFVKQWEDADENCDKVDKQNDLLCFEKM